MATNETLKNQIAEKNNTQPQKVDPNKLGLKSLLSAPTMKKKFEEVLDDKAPQFMSSLLNLYNGDPNIQKAEPMSIVSSAMVAASLDLPIDKNLGYAWIVPYWDSKKGQQAAQFQLGYKGYIQLALRTGQYRNINAIEVYEGELKRWNRLTEEAELDHDAIESDKVIGYLGYFELINGFRKMVYWSKDDIERHRNRFSKSGFVWKENYDAMALKTVIRNMLNKWGILSIEMQRAVQTDEKQVDYDFENDDVIDIEVDEPEEENVDREGLDQAVVDFEEKENAK
jgi:recombination protein RecT